PVGAAYRPFVMASRPPVEPRLPEPPGYGRGGNEIEGLVFLVLGAAAVWRFGFWWGIGIFLGGLTTTAFIHAVNRAAATAATSENVHRRKREPPAARLHSLATGIVGGALGFGASAALGVATGGLAGVAAATATYLVLERVVDLLLRMDWTGALGSQ